MTQYTSPALTTISQPFEEIGRLGIQKLITMIYGKPEKSILIKPEIIIRGSA
jgi:DNA-binding LacI/PurR family transcriptional regulator